jgi:hypothetical protein
MTKPKPQLPLSCDGLPDGMLLKTAEVASILRSCGSKVADMVGSGKLKGIRLPMARGLRVKVADLRKFIEERTLPMNADHPIVRARELSRQRRRRVN